MGNQQYVRESQRQQEERVPYDELLCYSDEFAEKESFYQMDALS